MTTNNDTKENDMEKKSWKIHGWSTNGVNTAEPAVLEVAFYDSEEREENGCNLEFRLYAQSKNEENEPLHAAPICFPAQVFAIPLVDGIAYATAYLEGGLSPSSELFTGSDYVKWDDREVYMRIHVELPVGTSGSLSRFELLVWEKSGVETEVLRFVTDGEHEGEIHDLADDLADMLLPEEGGKDIEAEG
jgi:hypothetical protein